MNQIPNIEEMSERFKKEFLAEGSECTWKDYPLATDVLDWVRLQEQTHHHQLQKARQEERERAVEIIKDELRTAPLEVQMTKGIIFASIVGRIQTDPVPTQVTV